MSDTTPAVAHHAFFDPATGTVTGVVWCLATRRAAVIDPVLDYNPASGHTATTSVVRVAEYLHAQGLRLDWILETHAHADHLSGARALQSLAGGVVAIGASIREVQAIFRPVFNLDSGADADAFDRLISDGERLPLGQCDIEALHVPGHTPADMAYVVGDLVFAGDTIFMPDVGTARADFPGGDARTLYRSIRRLLALPESTVIVVGHDYPPDGRAPRWTATVAEQRLHNIHVHDGIDEARFVARRQARDVTLAPPTLILPSLQVNIRGGALPAADSNGITYLRIPLNTLPVHARAASGAAAAAPAAPAAPVAQPIAASTRSTITPL